MFQIGESSGLMPQVFWSRCAHVPGSAPPPPCGAERAEHHRPVERPVLSGLLEHRPGDVPYSVHLELEAMRARLIHRAVTAALEALRALDVLRAMGGDEPSCQGHHGIAEERACGEGFGAEGVCGARGMHGPMAQRSHAAAVHEVYHHKWPSGGFIDLMI